MSSVTAYGGARQSLPRARISPRELRVTQAHTPCHMIRPTTTIALDGRERRNVQSATRRGRARHKAIFSRLVRAHARDMPKVTAILPTKNQSMSPSFIILLSDFIPGRESSWVRVRSISGSSLAGGASGIPPGCARCRRTSSTAWRRRCAARCTLTIRALVCGSCSITALVMYSSQRYGRLWPEDISIHALEDNAGSGRRG